ncbi:MAG: DNA methyltransferase [Acidimicrobiales bacterium]
MPTLTALETNFPIEAVSLLAEKESWRKEVHRPATHTHKWWAQRLGSVFRSILLGAVSTEAQEVTEALGTASSLDSLVVFDPFAGSGTTLVEAAKLGARVIARDINPVATLVQRQAVANWDWPEVEVLLKQVEHGCRDEIMDLYRSRTGEVALYYFWVASTECPDCNAEVEFFSDHVFARHAYARRHPQAQALCPLCRNVVLVDLSADSAIRCGSCEHESPMAGPVAGQWMTCTGGHRNRVVDALGEQRPTYRMYAKLVADARGNKKYQRVDDHDLDLYEEARQRLRRDGASLPQPQGRLEPGYNTRQALRWGFTEWAQFHNDRQLYCLGRIGKAVRDLSPACPEREALIALFSGTLEFNNLFCSYKGEGTGAVRHIFSHHILKPERTPLEANPWGTPLSSGSFSTLFDRRIRRAHDYKLSPHDLSITNGVVERVFGISSSTVGEIATTYAEFEQGAARFYIAPGDSARTDLPDASVDIIATDPPFMDNVHYSELADFFHAWLRQLQPFSGYPEIATTRSEAEVQSASPTEFGSAIKNVFSECARVLKPEGLLALTFHQARISGWLELMAALRAAGFVVTALQPVKAEMSVSATKAGTNDPSNLDSIVICRKKPASAIAEGVDAAALVAIDRLRRLQAVGIAVSRTDVVSVVNGTVLSLLTADVGHSVESLTRACAQVSSSASTALLGETPLRDQA